VRAKDARRTRDDPEMVRHGDGSPCRL
jgi:hypothetical protein